MTVQFPTPPRYVPYRDIGEQPNIIVDGPPLASTVLTLSHWPNNQTPDSVRRDTSTATVFAYLDMPEIHQDVPIVSNNHFDEDGLISMFALCQPAIALEHRALLAGSALAGDFGVYTDTDALRLFLIIEAFCDPAVSPLGSATFDTCERRQVVSFYREMLKRLPGLLADIDSHESLWAEQLAHIEDSATLIDRGAVMIEEYPDVDMAVVTIPGDLPEHMVRRYLKREKAVIHPFAIHNATNCNRILRVIGGRYELQYRYESWLQLVSQRPALRVSLEPLAERLNAVDTAAGIWCGEDVNEVVPRLYLQGAAASSLSPERFVDEVRSYLATAPVAWDPYDWAAA